MKNAQARLWLCIAISLVAACTRGKSKEPAEKSSSVQVAVPPGEQTKPASAAVDDDWLAGRLPASVREGTPVAGGELTVGIDTEPPSLNVSVDSDLVASWITLHRVSNCLLDLDVRHPPDYKYTPELAERWEISEDKKTYTFHLRKGVRWHDGQPFTARDVIATFDKVQDPTSKAAHVRALLAELASYAAPDDFTFVMKWKRAYAFTLDALTGIPIQPAHVIGKLTGRQYNEAATNPINRKPIGTGPFKFVSWESNSKIVLERNPDYWGEKTLLDRLVFRITSDDTVRMQLAERGEIDVLLGVKSDQWRNMDSPVLRKDWNRSRFVPNQYGWIGWNETRPMFADKRARLAMTMLIDRPGIVNKLMYGLPSQTECHFYVATNQCDPAIKPPPFDPEGAMKLLDEVGWKDSDGDGVRDKGGQPFSFVFMLPSGAEEASRWAAKIKEDMARAGVAMEIQKVEWSAFTKRLVEHNFDACTLLWGSSGPYDDPTQIWHSSSVNGGSNYISFKNAEADKLIEQARVEFDLAARDALYRKLGAILHDEQPYTFLYIRPMLELLHKRVKGAVPSLAWWNFETMWIDPALRRK
ncbi:MAG TPA: peptide-binding protein [Polyangiales bacterium]|nr:peptide-binding protein [Polyangiales bacterium]